MKNVQISYVLFMALMEYHLAYDNDCADEICPGPRTEIGCTGAA